MKVYQKKLFFICPIYNKKRSVMNFAVFMIGTFDASDKYQSNLYFFVLQYVAQCPTVCQTTEKKQCFSLTNCVTKRWCVKQM